MVRKIEKLTQHQMEVTGQSREEAECICRGNVCYFAGYFDAETTNRVKKLFQKSVVAE